MIPVRIGLGKFFCREQLYWQPTGHSSFAAVLQGNLTFLLISSGSTYLELTVTSRASQGKGTCLQIISRYTPIDSVLLDLLDWRLYSKQSILNKADFWTTLEVPPYQYINVT